jgi:hypothetical protein
VAGLHVAAKRAIFAIAGPLRLGEFDLELRQSGSKVENADGDESGKESTVSHPSEKSVDLSKVSIVFFIVTARDKSSHAPMSDRPSEMNGVIMDFPLIKTAFLL